MGGLLSAPEPEREWDTRPAYIPRIPRTAEEKVRTALKRSVEGPFCSGFTSYPFIAPDVECELAWLVEAKLSEMEFWSLRMQAFLVDPRSATPITRLIYGKLNKTEVYALMNGFNQEAEESMMKISMNDDWNWKWEKVSMMPMKKESAPNPKLRTLIDEARKEYSELLRKVEYRDIDVLYTGEDGRYEIVVNDQDKIIKAGGKLYARFSTNWEEWTIGMSVILPLKAFEKIFPEDRKNVIIRVNTPPADAEVIIPKKWYGVDSIQKSIHPIIASLGPNPSQEELKWAGNEVTEDVYARIKSDDTFREADKARSDLAKANAGPWYIGFMNFSHRDTDWTKETHPFSPKISSGNDQWWLADLELKRQAIQEWDEQGGNQRGWEDPEDEDFGLLKTSTQPMYPALCRTLLPDIDLQDREFNAGPDTASKQYWEQYNLCKNLERPYKEADENYLDHPNNFRLRAEFVCISRMAAIQQDRLDYWRKRLQGESNNPVQLPAIPRNDEHSAVHGDGKAVAVGTKLIDIPEARESLQRTEQFDHGPESDDAVVKRAVPKAPCLGQRPTVPTFAEFYHNLQAAAKRSARKPPSLGQDENVLAIEDLERVHDNSKAVVKSAAPKAPNLGKGKAKLHVRSRLAELNSERNDSKLVFPGPKPIYLCTAAGKNAAILDPEATRPAIGEKAVFEVSKSIGIRSAEGKKKVQFECPREKGDEGQ